LREVFFHLRPFGLRHYTERVQRRRLRDVIGQMSVREHNLFTLLPLHQIT